MLTLRNLDKGTDTTLVAGPDGRFGSRWNLTRTTQLMANHEGMLNPEPAIEHERTGAKYRRAGQHPDGSVPVVQPMIVADIFYDYDKWDIRPDAAVSWTKWP
ncbi:MAG: hypothetical protein IPL86_07280 [Flavobacteriales bacterium]|nr:hypothetical protein [Flavobacteriales bacterium]